MNAPTTDDACPQCGVTEGRHDDDCEYRQPADLRFEFVCDSVIEPWLTMHADGRLTVSEKITADEAAQRFLEMLRINFPAWLQQRRAAPVTRRRALDLLTQYHAARVDRECCGDECAPALRQARDACLQAMGVDP